MSTIHNEGHERLWGWFSLSRASFLTLPRVLMHDMPDEWQMKMAILLEEYEKASELTDSAMENIGLPFVIMRKDGKFARWPDWVLNYRHPNHTMLINSKVNQKCPF